MPTARLRFEDGPLGQFIGLTAAATRSPCIAWRRCARRRRYRSPYRRKHGRRGRHRSLIFDPARRVDLPIGSRKARPDERNPPHRLIKSSCGAFAASRPCKSIVSRALRALCLRRTSGPLRADHGPIVFDILVVRLQTPRSRRAMPKMERDLSIHRRRKSWQCCGNLDLHLVSRQSLSKSEVVSPPA